MTDWRCLLTRWRIFGDEGRGADLASPAWYDGEMKIVESLTLCLATVLGLGLIFVGLSAQREDGLAAAGAIILAALIIRGGLGKRPPS